jgi:hypothetical protein
MLTDLLRMAGGEGAELLRRWSAALLAAPASERRAIVEAVEKRIVELYASGDAATPETLLHIAGEPVERDGYTEMVVRSFTAAPSKRDEKNRAKKKRA